jgi:ATP-dependent RNA circularization protein (DNA/RNA ligase family)
MVFLQINAYLINGEILQNNFYCNVVICCEQEGHDDPYVAHLIIKAQTDMEQLILQVMHEKQILILILN